MNLTPMQWINVAAVAVGAAAGWAGWSEFFAPHVAVAISSGLTLAVGVLNFVVTGKPPVAPPPAPPAA